MNLLQSKLELPCGATIKNRIAKSAMTERIADPGNVVSKKHLNLYSRWAESECGLLISGNIIVDSYNLEGAGNIVLNKKNFYEQANRLRELTKVAKSNQAHFWAQLSHAGRQTPYQINKTPMAPSSVQLKIPGRRYGVPKEMSVEDIKNTINQFVQSAKLAQEVGFTGIQLHSAHGYLLSQFLSPNTNRRKDEWGGSLENRSRLLIEIIRKCRVHLGVQYPISVKLNSSDFQKGGFSDAESFKVAELLNDENIDLLEISGGTYEQAKFLGYDKLSIDPKANVLLKRSTVAREAYFLSYAEKISSQLSLPLMVTGGFRTAEGMNTALSSVCSMVGIARPLCSDPLAVKKLFLREIESLPVFEDKLSIGKKWLSISSPVTIIKALNALSIISWYYVQLRRMGNGLDPDVNMRSLHALFINEKLDRKSTNIYKKLLHNEKI